MKNTTFLLFVGMALVAPIINYATSSDSAIVRKERLISYIRSTTSVLDTRADALEQTLRISNPSLTTIKQARQNYESLRSAYKFFEPIIDYIDPTLVQHHINGAPLPRLDPKSQFVEVLSPSGLQVIDELLHTSDNEVLDEWNHLADLCTELRFTLKQASTLALSAPWTDRMMLEMCRSGVLRVTAMGITGFDRPASDPRMVDDVPVLSTIDTVLSLFSDMCANAGLANVHKDARQKLNNGKQLLQVGRYDTFDRARIIRDVFDPVFGAISTIHSTLQIETAADVGLQQPIVNPAARSMFNTDVLYPTVSSGIQHNQVTSELVQLGRDLFFDPILSENGERACASCHNPERAFTDGQPRSIALGRTGTISRNAPTLINAVHARRFFYDLRASRMSDVIAHVITREDEFGSTLIGAAGRIRSVPNYVERFSRSFQTPGEASIDPTNVGIAISAYLTTLVSFNSPIDRYLRGETASVSVAARNGFNLFMGKAACASCHFPPTFAGYVPPSFIDSESEIIGVPAHKATRNAVADADPGRAGGVLRENSVIYQGSFKTPTVRNVGLTAPYFHNGAYRTLSDVVDFYARGGGVGIGLHVPYQTLPFDRLNLSKKERRELVAFMTLLTDTNGLTTKPTTLPPSTIPGLERRRVGGEY